MRRVRRLTAIVILLGVVLGSGACASAPAPASAPASKGAGSSVSNSAGAPADRAVAPAAPSSKQSETAGQGATGQGADRMVIRSATMQLVVTNVDEVLSQVVSLSREMQGYMVSTDSQEQNGDRVGRASLRVPADRMEDALKRIREMATRVSRESSTAQDVTEEYVDQDARLRALQASEQQYLELMRKATTTEDIIRVQQSLTQVRTQIEQAQGRMQYLQRNSAMASISLELYTAGSAKPLDGGGWSGQDVLGDALKALIWTGKALASLAIWVVVFAPIWLPITLLVRWQRRRRGVKRATPPPAPATGV